MRCLPLGLFACTLLVPALALAQTPDASAVATPDARAPARPEPVARPAAPHDAGSPALAVTVELVSPLGGAGCVYRHRYVTAVIVIAGSLLGGGMLLDGLHRGDPDVTIIGAVAFGLMRALGIVAAAQPSLPPAPAARLQEPAAAPAPWLSVAPTTAAQPLGLSYRFSF